MQIQLLNNRPLLVLISSIFMSIAQQPLGLGFVAWFALVPFIYILANLKNLKETICYSFMWGFLYHLFTVFWLSQNIGTEKVIAFISMFLSVLLLSTNTILISLHVHSCHVSGAMTI